MEDEYEIEIDPRAHDFVEDMTARWIEEYEGDLTSLLYAMSLFIVTVKIETVH